MATYKGAAFVEQVEALGTRFFSAALTARVAPNTPVDGPNFELDATTANVTFVFGMTTTGVTPPQAPNKVDVTLYDARTTTVVDTIQLATPADGATTTLNLTTDGTGAGAALIGNLRLFIRAIKDNAAGGVGNYNVHSDDPAIQASGQNKQGIVRANPTTMTIAVTATPGGTPHAWPDTEQVSVTLSHGTKTDVASRSFAIRMRKSDISATYKGPTNTDTGTNTTRQLATPFDVDFAYPQASTSVVGEAVVNAGDLVPTSDATFKWIKVPAGATGRVDDATIRSSTFTVDPRLTITPTRTSSEAKVNFAFHTVTGSFTLANARATLLTNALAASKRDVVVYSRDLTIGADQKQISASISPNGSGVYLLPNYTYRGPVTLANRGVGLDGDTAVPQPATDVQRSAGRAKALKALIVGGSPNAPFAVSGTFVTLSDLLDLNVHPQKTSTLVQDVDPYASPGSGETTSFVIGSDGLRLFAFVGDVNRQAVLNVNVTFSVYDPDGVSSGTPQTYQTSSGSNAGWTITSANFNVVAPAGAWKARAGVELNVSGAQGNYGNGTAVSPNDLTALDQSVSYTSSYSANRAVALHVPSRVKPGSNVTIVAEYRSQGGTRINFDTNPSLRIYSVNPSTGAETVIVALTAMTRIASLDVWALSFTAPSTNSDCMVELRGIFTESGIEACEPFSVRVVPEADVQFDAATGHHHVGTDSRAIGDRS